MSKHTRKEQRRRALAFKQFERMLPPRMPAEFSNKEYKRVLSYARIAFTTGWNSGQNDLRDNGKARTWSRG